MSNQSSAIKSALYKGTEDAKYGSRKMKVSAGVSVTKEWEARKLKEAKVYEVPPGATIESLIKVGEHFVGMLVHQEKEKIGVIASYLAIHLSVPAADQHGVKMILLGCIDLTWAKSSVTECPDWVHMLKNPKDDNYMAHPFVQTTGTSITAAGAHSTLKHAATASSATPEDHPIIVKIRTMTATAQVGFYTYLAFCLLRGPFTQVENIYKRPGGQIDKILQNFESFYVVPLPFPVAEFNINPASMLQIARVCNQGSHALNTVIASAAIRRFEPENVEFSGIIDFGLLQRASFSGMHVYNLFVRAVHVYKVEVSGLLSLLSIQFAEPTVLKMSAFIQRHECPDGEAPLGKYAYWHWARALDSLYFTEFHTKENLEFGYLIACFLVQRELKAGSDPRDIVAFQDISKARRDQLQDSAQALSMIVSSGTDDMEESNVFSAAYRANLETVKAKKASQQSTSAAPAALSIGGIQF